MKFIHLALLSGAASVAVAQPHAHSHNHMRKHLGSKVVVRDDIVEVIPGPEVTTFITTDGEVLTEEEAEAGLADGKYVMVGETTPTLTAAVASVASSTPAPSSTSTSSVSSSSSEAAQFFQHSSSVASSSSVYTPSSSSTPTPTPSSSSVASSSATPSSTYTPSSSSSSSAAASSSTATGIDATFPSGQISCDTFPSDYGAVAVDYLGLDGWLSVQQCDDYVFDVSTAISSIVDAVEGGCVSGAFCSYACPAGYQKSQWPSAQGSSGQSIGGLYCNSDGYLELTNSDYDTICISGVGNVYVENKLSTNAAICRTNYPGDEAETVPLNTESGQTYALTNPDGSTYYKWEGDATSAQYYFNPSGYSLSEACVWGESGTNLGNWAPLNAGVGESDGVTYLSLFPNSPTNPDGVLDYTVTITGDVTSECKYTGGTYYLNDVEDSAGCTVSITSGGTATFVLS